MAQPPRGRGFAAAIGLLLLATASAVPALAQPGAGASVDGSIRERDLWHDSRDDRYRTPQGAVSAGTPVLLRVRTAAGDVAAAQARFTDRASGESWAVPMELAATDPDAGRFGYDYWQVEVETRPFPGILDYSFVVSDLPASRHLFDDRAVDGGIGQIGRASEPGRGWQLTYFEPGFETPEWAVGGVAYQVFPDRFANADPGNDPTPDATPEAQGSGRYRRGDVYGEPVVLQPWAARPENHCRGYVGVDCPEPEAFNRDFFGGDLAGLTRGLERLADLGVTAIYLNPIFASPSNHRYDTSDYRSIDPGLGTLADFDALMAEADRLGIHVVLDGVFNHVSSDSPWFDRYGHFEEIGACESAESPYRSWFEFQSPGPLDPAPCAPSEAGADDRYYRGWFGFDTIPELEEVEAVEALIAGEGGVVRQWIDRGAAGWRLDAADVMSPRLLRAIRDAAKAADPESLIIAEQWHDSTPWLLGDQADSTTNYRFRRAVIALVNGATADPDGALEALGPNGFASAMMGIREDYPEPAYHVLMNLVDSHDTVRILWTLTPGIDNDAAKSEPIALAEGKRRLRLVSTIQLTMPGLATIYYGDEVGLSGHDDPDDRRPYPWAAEDGELREHYRTLARLRTRHEALREGDLEFLLADDARRTLAYLRRSDDAAAVVALNLSDRPRELGIRVAARIPDGVELSDALGTHDPVSVVDGHISITLPADSAAVLVTRDGVDLTAPAAPGGLVAEAGVGEVSLTWKLVADASAYEVWRSLLSGGGYERIGASDSTAFTDDSVRDGVPYHYVVTALDEVGNVSTRSAEARAVPTITLTSLILSGLVGPAGTTGLELEHVLSAEDGAVGTIVEAMAVAPADRIAGGVIVETGVGPAGSDPRSAAGWSWAPAELVDAGQGKIDGAARFVGSVQPEGLGRHAVAARATTDGGQTYRYADEQAQLVSIAGDDTDAPPAPSGLEFIDVTGDRVRLRWEASTASDLYRYLVLRAPDTAGPFEVLGSVETPVFTDATVSAGSPYVYAVQAQDLAYNTSPRSSAESVIARDRIVAVTFAVTVPARTTTGETVYIAGGFQGWDPAGTPMTRIDDQTWSIDLEFDDREALDYKYTRGTWDTVEKDADCGEIPNRTVAVEHGTGGVQLVADEVMKWRDLDACG